MEVVIATPFVRHVVRDRLLGVRVELLARQRPGEMLLDVREEVERPRIEAIVQPIAAVQVQAVARLIGPLAIGLIFMILFALYGNFKFPVTIALGVIMTEPVGALVA